MCSNRGMGHGDESHLFNSRVKTFDSRMECQDIYKGDSVYEEDYRFYVPEKRRVYKWPKDKSEMTDKVTRKAPQKRDQETYFPMKPDAQVPFNLLWDPKPIIGPFPEMKLIQNKDEIQEKHSRIIAAERLQANRSRSDTILSPAVRLDGVEYNDVKTIITSMYGSDWKRAAKQTADAHFNCKANKTYPICTGLVNKEIRFIPNVHPVILNNSRRRSRSWDKLQARKTVDPTAAFWLNNELKENDTFATEKLVTQETKQKIKQLIKEDKLRTAHDLTNPLYDGFYPRVSYGVTLEKKHLPVTHPNISVSQAITARYTEDLLETRKATWEKWGLQ